MQNYIMLSVVASSGIYEYIVTVLRDFQLILSPSIGRIGPLAYFELFLLNFTVKVYIKSATDGVVIACDVDEDFTAIAKKFWYHL